MLFLLTTHNVFALALFIEKQVKWSILLIHCRQWLFSFKFQFLLLFSQKAPKPQNICTKMTHFRLQISSSGRSMRIQIKHSKSESWLVLLNLPLKGKLLHKCSIAITEWIERHQTVGFLLFCVATYMVKISQFQLGIAENEWEKHLLLYYCSKLYLIFYIIYSRFGFRKHIIT